MTGFLLSARAGNPMALAKLALRATRRRWIRTFHAFSPENLEASLRRLGIARGDTVLVHSSFDAFEGFTGKASDVLAVLGNILGPQGTLLVPTMPFTGTALAYAQADPVFDVLRTPSRMGLLTELFRRSPGVLRSLHPTHAVAASGARAAQMIAGHESAQTPCGVGSPYHKLLECDGRILLLGTDISALTFFHTLEEILEQELPLQPFTAASFRLRTRAADGSLVYTQTRLFEPAVSRRRNIFKLVPYLRAGGFWRQTSVGKLDAVLLNAREVLAAASDMLARGEFCYD
jgi:aminoglycoside 3-N-acetyltransferase